VIATLLFLAVIGAIVHGSRRSRREHVREIPAKDRDETWRFDVRDMRGEVVRSASKNPVRSFDLRRSEEGIWELAERRQGPLEAKYRRYHLIDP
jgi:hypothetical protein